MKSGYAIFAIAGGLFWAAPLYAQDVVLPAYKNEVFCTQYQAALGGFERIKKMCLRQEQDALAALSKASVFPDALAACLTENKKTGESYYFLYGCLKEKNGFVSTGSPDTVTNTAPAQQSASSLPAPQSLVGHEQAFFQSVFKEAFGSQAQAAQKEYSLASVGTEKNDVAIKVIVKKAPQSLNDIRIPLEMIMKGIVKTLGSWGHKPAESQLNIYCFMVKEAQGLTGQAQEIFYGQVNYRNATDSAEFVSAK